MKKTLNIIRASELLYRINLHQECSNLYIFKPYIKYEWKWEMCQRNNNPIKEQETTKGHQRFFNTVIKPHNQRRTQIIGRLTG